MKKRNKTVHKQKYLEAGTPSVECGQRGNIANHSDWGKVTCQRCLAKKPFGNMRDRTT